MPYGILEEYAQEGYIDFSKLGKRHININTWKYYKWQTGDSLILNYDSPLSMTFCPKLSETSRYTEISRHYEPENIGTNYNAYL